MIPFPLVIEDDLRVEANGPGEERDPSENLVRDLQVEQIPRRHFFRIIWDFYLFFLSFPLPFFSSLLLSKKKKKKKKRDTDWLCEEALYIYYRIVGHCDGNAPEVGDIY